MSSATVGGRKPVSTGGRHRAGRHQAPGRPQKARVARSAAIALPAIAVLGTLAAIPQVRDMVAGSPAAARHATASDVVSRAQAASTYDAAAALRGEAQGAQHAKTAHAIAGVHRAVASAQKADAAAKARRHTLEKIKEVWALASGFSGYAFCKAHSTAYGIEAWQSAWLKRYFPAEFMAAVRVSPVRPASRATSSATSKAPARSRRSPAPARAAT